jgi:hypothetical protein
VRQFFAEVDQLGKGIDRFAMRTEAMRLDVSDAKQIIELQLEQPVRIIERGRYERAALGGRARFQHRQMVELIARARRTLGLRRKIHAANPREGP